MTGSAIAQAPRRTVKHRSALRRPGWAVLALALTGLIGLNGCTSGKDGAAEKTRSPSASPSPTAPPAQVAIASPRNGQRGVPTGTEIAMRVIGGQVTAATLLGPGNRPVPGAFYPGTTTWVPARQLAFNATYRVNVTAVNPDGKAVTATSRFSTLSGTDPNRLMNTALYMYDHEVVGVGMPVVVEFGVDVENRFKPAVERHLSVMSTPVQEGAWHWWSDHEVHFRPKVYWQPGTKLAVRIGVGGMPVGDGWYGVADRTASVTVGPKQVIAVNNVGKQLSVIRDDRVIRRMPVSLGKPSSPSSSGNLVVMERKEQEWFDSSTYGVPISSAAGYRTLVYWDLRITWGGEYIHAAPWSVGDQGHRNVSHGCTNLSTENARWLFNNSRVGDPVVVRGTEAHIQAGDGWTDWELPWAKFLQGSKLPHPLPTASPTASPSGTASAGPTVTATASKPAAAQGN